jgi:hypothetical protein
MAARRPVCTCGASWFNLTERFFRDLSHNRIRCGTFASARELGAAIARRL